jgi:predicted O-methyltransferase YrrM
LPELVTEAPFDLIFIDADKPNTPLYFEWAVKLARKGSLIVVDNVVREGAIRPPRHGDRAPDRGRQGP